MEATNVQSTSSSSSEESQVYTDEEKKILEHTSLINCKMFLPFMNTDSEDKLVVPTPFTDKDGLLQLAPKQMEHFIKWQRISQICRNPKIIYGPCVDYLNVKQSVVGDCSFVAALSVAAAYQQRFNEPLITSTIYPRNPKNEPVYNPSGKYVVKLHMNGIPRKVVIDDYLPTGPQNILLCSHSTQQSEFWMSILEKAFVKLMGGYNFPGSTPSHDVHTLTGWIPESVLIREEDTNFNSADVFERLQKGLNDGCCLVTLSMRKLSDEEEEQAGLIGEHAYALLELKETDGVKMCRVKNPWSQRRYKGKYSEYDSVHWTTKLQQLLGYDPKVAAKADNGVFWIDYDSLLHYCSGLFLNWKPALFRFTSRIHDQWSPDVGVVARTIGDSPQYLLSVSPGRGSVWVLLTTHITNYYEDNIRQKLYIILQVFLNNGRKVYFPYNPYINGIRFNSQHFLCKLTMDPTQTKKYTLVVTRNHEPITNYYTIRVYSAVPFELQCLERENFKNLKGMTKNIRNFLKV